MNVVLHDHISIQPHGPVPPAVLRGAGQDLEVVFVGEGRDPRYDSRYDKVGVLGSFVMDFIAARMGHGLMEIEAGASALLCSQAGAWEQEEAVDTRGTHTPWIRQL